MSDDRQEPPAGGDRTQRMPRADDATARQESVTGGQSGAEPTDRTAPLPPTERPGPAPWSGRAEVPPPRRVDYREPAEWYAEEQRGRRWWMPILLGILALLLLGLLGVALWLALRSAEVPKPEQSPSPLPTSARQTTAAPTSAAPSTTPPTNPPTTTAAARVPMPPLVGLPRATAQAILDRLDLDYRVETRPSDRPPGTVVETDPDAGELVPVGQEVRLVIAEPAEPTTSAAVPTPTAGATATR